MAVKAVQLDRVADIVSGYPHRRWAGDDQPTHRLVPISAIDDQALSIRIENTQPLRPNADVGPARLREGDVLFAIRGGRRRAGVVGHEGSAPLVASEHTVILRPSPGIDARFLAWVLATPGVQRQLDAISRGSHIPFISRFDLAEIRIPIPPLPRQHAIVALADLVRREHDLCSRLANLRARLLYSPAVLAGPAREESRHE
ncbi:MAG: restriction endonuclease subunit S [Phycisphaerae bacterium]|nr:restriction endonuclease subunit S [Phycisphaerae bacterium]